MPVKFYAYCFTTALGCLQMADAYSQANTALSNLAATSVNQDIVPGVANARNLGSAVKAWRGLYLDSAVYFAGSKFVSFGKDKALGSTAVGLLSLTVSSGVFNTAIGNKALQVNTTGKNNAAVGSLALGVNTTGQNNDALGHAALFSNKIGSDNNAMGAFAMEKNASGQNNTAIGSFALHANTAGSANIAIGMRSLFKNLSGNNSIAIGDSALFNNENNYHNVAIGSKAMYQNTTGYYNVAVGYQALFSNTVSGYNTAIGYQALRASTESSYDNTGTGYQALYANTSGSRNTSAGVWALLNNTTGSNNVANGVYALQLNQSGNDNVADGFYAAFYNNGTSNIAIGSHALFNNSNGNNLVAVGDSALYSQSGGSGYNTALGSKSLYSNTIGVYQTAVGFQSLFNNTASFSNSAYGYQAMYSNKTGSYNTGIGLYALFGNTNGAFNTGIGLDALNRNSSGSSNTGLGTYSNVNVDGLSNATAIGYNAIATASNQVMLGSTAVNSVKAAGAFVIYSDGRFKKDVEENVPGLEFINKLRPVSYHYNIHGMNDQMGISALRKEAASRRTEKDADGGNAIAEQEEKAMTEKEKKLYTGFIAQEVEEAAKKAKFDFGGIYKPQNDKDIYGLSYSDFVAPLVKAVQELSKQNAELREEIEELKTLIKDPNATGATLNGASLSQNSPNPVKGNTVIQYNIPTKFRFAQLVVYDAYGQPIKQVNITAIGRGTLNLNVGSLAAGEYNYSLLVDGKAVSTRKMILVH